MSKKFKVIISVLIATLLLTVGGTAVAMAQDETTPEPQSEARGLLARVANILGVTQEQLVAAFQQARQEMREECQATDNCNICQEKLNMFRERCAEKRQKWAEKWQEKREKYQATDNCTICQEKLNRFRERCEEKQQKWAEKEREMGRRFQCSGMANQQSTVFASLQPYVVSR